MDVLLETRLFYPLIKFIVSWQVDVLTQARNQGIGDRAIAPSQNFKKLV